MRRRAPTSNPAVGSDVGNRARWPPPARPARADPRPWTRQPPPSDAPGKPLTVEAAAFDFVEATALVLVQRQPVEVIIGGRELSLDGARNLIAALTELVEAVEEGTR